MILRDNERYDAVNDDISLIQKKDGLTFGTDALLLSGYVFGKYKRGLELGGGTGIISMLLLTRGKLESCDALEVQEEYAELISRNAEHNGLSERLRAIHIDAREYKDTDGYDLVFTNPPYMKTDSGKRNYTDSKNIARHEVYGTIYDFLEAAKRLLKFGGAFYAVYRPDRLIDLISAMRENKIEPKRMTFVHADLKSEPSMVLIEGRLGGKSGARVTAPLIIYEDSEHTKYTSEMDYIMENGVFSDTFCENGRKRG